MEKNIDQTIVLIPFVLGRISAGINLQSTKSDLTPRILTLGDPAVCMLGGYANHLPISSL